MAEEVKTQVRLYRFRNRLRDKTAGLGGEVVEIDIEALQAAEAALAEMAEDYPDWVMKEIEALSELHRRCVDTPEERKEFFSEIAEKAHDMKGQGGTFGYPLITSFAESLYTFSDAKGELSDSSVELIKNHVDAMRAVIKGRISGDGGEIGKEMQSSLDEAIKKKLVKK